jgi:hypothetical protein
MKGINALVSLHKGCGHDLERWICYKGMSWACVGVCFIRAWDFYSIEQELILLIKVALMTIANLNFVP